MARRVLQTSPKPIGTGGQAEVYLAVVDIGGGVRRREAMKAIKTEHVAAALSEANTVLRLSESSRIVPVYEVTQGTLLGEQWTFGSPRPGRTDPGRRSFVCIFMQLMAGGTLADRINARGRLPEAEALGILIETAKALRVAHHAGVLHRDVKAANIMFDEHGESKLGDFGIADRAGAAAPESGSLYYWAPELHDGGIASIQTDLFALGVCYYQMLSGHLPFLGSSPREIRASLTRGAQPIPDITDHSRRILDWLLARTPEARPRDADALLSAAKALAVASDVPARRQDPSNPPGPSGRVADGHEVSTPIVARRSPPRRVALGVLLLGAGLAALGAAVAGLPFGEPASSVGTQSNLVDAASLAEAPNRPEYTDARRPNNESAIAVDPTALGGPNDVAVKEALREAASLEEELDGQIAALERGKRLAAQSTTATTVKQGGFDEDEVSRVFRRVAAQIQYCHQKWARDPQDPAQLAAHLEIGGSGKVEGVTFFQVSDRAPPPQVRVIECMTTILQRLRFPPSPNGDRTAVRYSWSFPRVRRFSCYAASGLVDCADNLPRLKALYHRCGGPSGTIRCGRGGCRTLSPPELASSVAVCMQDGANPLLAPNTNLMQFKISD